MFKSLRNRFLLMNMITTTLMIVGAFLVIYLYSFASAQSEIQRRLSAVGGVNAVVNETGAYQMQGLWETEPGLEAEATVPYVHSISYTVSADYSPTFVLILDEEGEVVLVQSTLNMPSEFYMNAAESVDEQREEATITLNGRDWQYAKQAGITTSLNTNGQTLSAVTGYPVAFLDVTETRQNLKNLLLIFVGLGIPLLIVIFLISWTYSNRSIRPIEQMWEKQKQFVADASHELKTPLSIITSNYDVLMTNLDSTVESQKEWLSYIKIGTERMGKLINDLLFLARTEDGGIEIYQEGFDFSSLIAQEMSAYEARIGEKDLALVPHMMEGVWVNSDKEKVRQIFSILFENAIKYTEDGGNIIVEVSRIKKQVVCTVKNSGQGLGPQELKRVFDRFYQSDKARTGDGGGYGLGLSIARVLVERLEGHIVAYNEKDIWTVFQWTLPLGNEEHAELHQL